MRKPDAAPAPESERVAEALRRARRRLHRQRETLRPLGLTVIAVVVIGAAGGHPAAGGHGKQLAVTVALATFSVSLLAAIADRFVERGDALQAAVIATAGAAGVTLAALQPTGPAGVATGAAAFVAIARLPRRAGLGLGAATTVALGAAEALAGGSSGSVASAILVTALLGLVALFLKQSRASQDRTEVLLARLQDARDEQARAAALAERSRIAGELHDVLAHSLSGAAIQLQGARKLADRAGAESPLSDAIERASELVKAGLVNARQAVGALRGEPLPTVAQLPALVADYQADMQLDVTLRIEGEPRALAPEPSLALYRSAQEALTNVARHAPSARTTVLLRYEPDRTTLSVDNGRSAAAARAGLGGGRGLEGMRERIERAGGTIAAGPSGDGWHVRIELPG